MRIIIIILCSIAALVVLAAVGLRIKPKPFAPFPERTTVRETAPIPPGLPAPVERFFKRVYGDRIQVVRTVVMTGRAVIKPFLGIPLQARFVFMHNAGRDYRHYFEAVFFGLPFLKVNEGYVNGRSFFESPMGTYYDDPNTNQGANLALWAEGAMFPSIFITDPRVRWQPVDDNTALLFVPYGEGEENFTVRFDPETSLIAMMEAMRYRNPGDAKKLLWITRNVEGKTFEGSVLHASGSATWLPDGKPWAVFTAEDIAFNADLSAQMNGRGYTVGE